MKRLDKKENKKFLICKRFSREKQKREKTESRESDKVYCNSFQAKCFVCKLVKT